MTLTKVKRLTGGYSLVLVFGAFGFLSYGSICAQDASKTKVDEKSPYADLVLNALLQRRVQKQLDLVGEQTSQIQALAGQIKTTRDDMGRTLKQFSSGATKEQIDAKREELTKQFEVVRKDIQASALAVLLPHQQERLGQLTAQVMIGESAKTHAAGVLAPEMKKYLGIDEKQAERIAKRSTEVRQRLLDDIKKLNDEIKKLTAEARDELMKELTPKQREKYKKLIGDPIGN